MFICAILCIVLSNFGSRLSRAAADFFDTQFIIGQQRCQVQLHNVKISCLQCGSAQVNFQSGRVETATPQHRAYALVLPGNLITGEDDSPEIPMAFDCYLQCTRCGQMQRLEITGMADHTTIINLRKSVFEDIKS
jgi:hypothetical protein